MKTQPKLPLAKSFAVYFSSGLAQVLLVAGSVQKGKWKNWQDPTEIENYVRNKQTNEEYFSSYVMEPILKLN